MPTRAGAALRDYSALVDRALREGLLPRERAMRVACDLIWDAFGLDTPGLVRGGVATRVSWIGFYEKTPTADEMILVARRDKPACSPIGLHGMCGRSFLDSRPILIADVATLGANYIACDPKDKSEAVVPLFGNDGKCWGVFDADSYEVGAFDEADIRGMTGLCEALGLSVPRAPAEPLRL